MKKTRQKRHKRSSQVYDSALKELIQQQIPDILPILLPALSEKFVWMEVLLRRTDTIDAKEKIEIQRRLAMYEHLWAQDPKIKQIKTQAKEEGERKGEIKDRRQSIIDIVEMRFPDLKELAVLRVRKINNLEKLTHLMKQLAVAPDEATARSLLSTDVA